MDLRFADLETVSRRDLNVPGVNEIALDVVKRHYSLIYTEYNGELQTLRIQQCSLNFSASLIVRSYALRGGQHMCARTAGCEEARFRKYYSHVKQLRTEMLSVSSIILQTLSN